MIDTSAWGVPDVRFVNDQCNIPAHFKRQKIIINLTFCTFPPPVHAELTDHGQAVTGRGSTLLIWPRAALAIALVRPVSPGRSILS